MTTNTNKADEQILRLKTMLMEKLSEWIKTTAGNQTIAAEILGISKARASDLANMKTHLFRIDMLVGFAVTAGLKVKMTVS